jgi:hypothetical protein
MNPQTCSICDQQFTGYGNPAWPVNDGRCCDQCNMAHVVPARIALAERRAKRQGGPPDAA